MTYFTPMEMYCEKCQKMHKVNVLLSTNSWTIKADPVLREKAEKGTLFQNFCPECGGLLRPFKEGDVLVKEKSTNTFSRFHEEDDGDVDE